MKTITNLFISIILIAGLSACNQEELDSIKAQIEELKTTQIASITTQISNIQASITTLEKMDAELKKSIEDLAKKEQELENTDDAQAKEIAALRETITQLETSLSKRIDDLKTYVDEELKKQSDWVSATFSTLEQYQSTCTEIASIKQSITNQETTLKALISATESSIKSWVNEQLTGYYTIAQMDAKISALEKAIKDGDDAQAAELDKLKTALETAKTELTNAYNAAITAAITENNGTINQKIADDIKAATDTLQQQINAISTRVDSLELRVATLEADLTTIINMVQSVVVIPSFSDGSVSCSAGDNDFFFEVLPSGLASKLATAGKDIFSMKAVYTATKSAPSFVALPITSVQAEGDILIITASASDLSITPEQQANASLTITSGYNSISTGYFPLFFSANTTKLEASLSASTPFSASFFCRISKINDITEYGIGYSEGSSICNNTVKVNTLNPNDGTYTVDITSLTPGTKYYFRAYAIKDGIASYSEVKSFETGLPIDMVQTVAVGNVTAFSASINATIDYSLTSYPHMTVGVCYSSSSNSPSIDDQYQYQNVSDISNDGTFQLTLYGLVPGVKYYCRAFVNLNGSVLYGDVKNFTTDNSNAVVITGGYENLTHSAVTVSGVLNIDKTSYSSLAYGFVFQGKTIMASNLDENMRFSIDRSSLKDNTQYTYQAIASIDGTMYYGEEVSFTTPQVLIATDKVVDLGLSVKWAGYNVGASKPEEFGDYYAWGETSTKTSYSWSNYQYCMGTKKTITKYNSDSYYGVVDNKTDLEPKDDAATKNWGNDWRTPTREEWSELYNNCEWYYTTYNGVNGFKAISKKNGFTDVSIFFPEAGCYGDNQSGYWSSYGDRDEAWFFYFSGNFIILNYSGGGRTREYGRTVRAVKE